MNLVNTFTRTASLLLQTTRGILQWGESLSPWPLSLLPRAARLPLDLIALFDPHAGTPSDDEAAQRAQRPQTPPADAAAVKQSPAEQSPARKRKAPQRDEHRTAAIAGTHSDDPQVAIGRGREFRSRLAPLYTRDAGQGPALVMLHAFPLNSRMWEPQLVGLADRFRVIAPDLAGFGLSPAAEHPFSLEDHAHAVEVTLDEIGVGELILVGSSMGGYVSFPLLERLEERVRGLVLANTKPTADGEKAIAERHRLAAEVERSGVDVAVSELMPRLLGATTLRDAPDVAEYVQALARENKQRGVADALRAMAARPDSTRALARIRCPVLIIAGDEDVIIERATTSAMAARLPLARLVLLHAGHLPNLETPDEFNDAIAEFADDLTSDARQTPRPSVRAAYR